MPPKKTTPAGELTAPELRKLIRAHNILSKITIPKGTDREGLIKLIEGKKYKIDHKNKVIKPQQQRGKQITLKQAEELTKPKPVSEAVKKQRAEKKKEQEEEKKKEIKVAKKEAVQEFKQKKKEAEKEIKKAEKLNQKKDLKIKSISNHNKDMGETAFIKQQKKLQLEKQNETRRALLKAKSTPDKTTRRGKPVEKKELTLAEKKEKLKQLEKEAIDLEKKKSDKKEILKSDKKPFEVKDFTIIMKGKNYNKEEFMKWVDTKGYKFSKQQLEKLNFLVSERGLQSFRHYYNSNGVLVLVPTLKFNASTKVYNPETKKYEYISIGEVLSELAGERGGSLLKLELKPKVKIELTPEKIKEYDMTRLQFIKEELPSLEKNLKETKDKLEVYLKGYKELEDKNSPSGYSGSNGGLPFIRELQESKAKDWLYMKQSIPQPVRDWYDKNVKDIQRLNLIVSNIYDTIKSYKSKQKQLENKYN